MIIFYQYYFVFIFKSCGRNNRSPSGLLFQQIWYISTHLHCCTNDISSYKNYWRFCHNLYNNFRQKLKLPLFVTMNRSHVPPSCFYEFLFVGHIFFSSKKMYKKSFGWAADDISKMLIPINVQKDEWKFREKLFKKRLNDFFPLWVINLITNYKF